jgi:hypothetical protein
MKENNGATENEGKNKKRKKKKKQRNLNIHELRVLGDSMKPFSSFYDPKAMEPPFGPPQIDRFERNIYREVEIAIKQVRSSKNLNTKIKKLAQDNKNLLKFLEFIED